MTFKTLIISPFFYPEPISTGKYNTVLASALYSRGDVVQVIASHPVYPNWKPKSEHEELDGIQVSRGGGSIRYPSSTLMRRMLLETWFTVHVFVELIHMRIKGDLPDVVLPVFPPSLFFIGCLIVLPSSVKKIGIVHDLQGVHIMKKKGLLGLIVRKAIGLVEKIGFLSCHRIVFLSNDMRKEAVNSYNLNSQDCDVFYPPVSINIEECSSGNALRGKFPDGYKHIVYSGALGEKQSPFALLQLFKDALDNSTNWMFHFYSQGPLFDALKKEFEGKIKQITFHDIVSEKEVSELYRCSDIQVVPQQTGTSKGSLPSKVPNLIAVGVRIVAIADQGSELDRMLLTVDGATVIHGWSKDEFVGALNLALEDTRSNDARRASNMDVLINDFAIDSLLDVVSGFHKEEVVDGMG